MCIFAPINQHPDIMYRIVFRHLDNEVITNEENISESDDKDCIIKSLNESKHQMNKKGIYLKEYTFNNFPAFRYDINSESYEVIQVENV